MGAITARDSGEARVESWQFVAKRRPIASAAARRNQLAISPMSRLENPLAVARNPLRAHPVSSGRGALFIVAGSPDILVVLPAPMARLPNPIGTRRHGHNLDLKRRRRPRDHDFSDRWLYNDSRRGRRYGAGRAHAQQYGDHTGRTNLHEKHPSG